MQNIRVLTLISLLPLTGLAAQSGDLADGVAAVNAGDTPRAIALLERAVAAQPASRLALLHLANAHMAAWPDEDYDALQTHGEAAIVALQRALQHDARDTLAQWNLAMTYGRLERLAEGVSEMKRLLAIDPAYPDGARTLGTLLALHALEETRRIRRAADAADRKGAPAIGGTRPTSGIGEWIEDAATREKLRSVAGRSVDDALEWLERARALDPASADAVAMTNFALRLRAQMAADASAAERDRRQADAFVQQAAMLRRQRSTPAVTGDALDPAQPPAPFSAPGAPPPPPPG